MVVPIHHQVHDGTPWKAKLVAIPRPPSSTQRDFQVHEGFVVGLPS